MHITFPFRHTGWLRGLLCATSHTAESLEEIASEKTKTDCALITTYERDSIWHNEGLISVAPTDIEKPQRMLLLRGRKYRYQEIRAAEVLKLLQNPLGTIPISRPSCLVDLQARQ